MNNFVSTLWNILPTSRDLILRQKENTSKPMNIIMCLEEACNLHCIQCDIWKTRTTKLKLSLNQRKFFIDNLKEWVNDYTLIFFSGEPFLHPQIFDLVTYASSLGVKTMLTTNGTLLHEKNRKKIVESKLTTMIVSVDGYKAETHDKIRGYKGTYKRVMDGLLPMLSLRNRQNSPRIFIEALILNENYKELIDLVHWAYEIGVDGIGFQPVTSKYGFGRSEYMNNWHKTPESLLPRYDEIYPILRKLIEMKKLGYRILNPIEHLQNSIIYFRDPEAYVKRVHCRAHDNFVITDDGGVLLCFSQKKIGNAFLGNYKQLWSSSAADYVRNQDRICNKTSKILLCNSSNLARETTSCSQLFIAQS